MKLYCFYFILIITLFCSKITYAWGAKGHEIVSEVAFNYLDESTKKIVLHYLDGMTIQEAATWMDRIKKDQSLNYMKPYHYANFQKGATIKNNSGTNIIAVLSKAIAELKNHKKLSKKEVKMRLLFVFHLIGDLHEPLHVGYASDKGGNKVQINFKGKGTNLHSFYDSGIIKYKKIKFKDCLNPMMSTKKEVARYRKINVVEWAKESRSFLPEIYNFKGHKVSEEYVDKNTVIIKSQLFKAGIRLASVLNLAFKK
jgi:hypothetical protein